MGLAGPAIPAPKRQPTGTEIKSDRRSRIIATHRVAERAKVCMARHQHSGLPAYFPSPFLCMAFAISNSFERSNPMSWSGATFLNAMNIRQSRCRPLN